jgi:primary-amine oxidase
MIRFVAISLLIAVSGLTHPLDPLSRHEIASAVAILRSEHHLTRESRFPLLALHEPPKVEVLAGRSVARQAFAIVYERAPRQTFEAVVDLTAKRVASWTEIKGVQPPLLMDDFILCEQIVRADPGWRAAMRKRGITDFSKVQIDAWSSGYHGVENEELRRSVRAVSYLKVTGKSAYTQPIEGVVAFVDLVSHKVERLVDTGVVPLPSAPAMESGPAMPPRPLKIVQPDGPGFSVDGQEVRWDHWRFRFAMHPREGLVLYTVAYEDHGKLRTVLYRASLSEMLVPYGDTGPAWNFRNIFDNGEYAYVGRSVTPLKAGVDAPENASFYDADFADEEGNAYRSVRAVALYERDGGLQWRYTSTDTGKTAARRARDLVLSTILTAGNYEYGFNWVFHQDGRLEQELLLTGIMASKGVADHQSEHGHPVAPNLEAVHHQHFFNFRLDLDVDGTANSVVEVDTVAGAPGPDDPYQKGIATQETAVRTEKDAARQMNLAAGRKWKVINPGKKNELGESVGFLLVPGENAVPYASPSSWIRKRAGFLNAHLWVTAYDPAEQYAAGTYINQNKGGEGLPKWVQANRSLENRDVVLWYTLGVTHIPRPEEWPVMSVHHAGFQLVPSGFFTRNPALD